MGAAAAEEAMLADGEEEAGAGARDAPADNGPPAAAAGTAALAAADAAAPAGAAPVEGERADAAAAPEFTTSDERCETRERVLCRNLVVSSRGKTEGRESKA